MAVNKIARKSSKFRVVFTVPDFCWPPPPAPPSVPLIPFPLFADLGGAKTVAKDVRLNRKPAFVFKASKTDTTYGDEIALPGRKGVKSRTATKPAWPMCHSSSVKIRKRYIVRTGDMFHMNGKFSKRLPPKTCLSCKGAVGAGRPVNPIHGLKFLTNETDFAFEGILPLVWSRSYYSDQDGNLVRAATRHSITCFDYNGNGQIIGQHQWKVPTKEENARNGLPETDWRDAQYDMLYLPVTETVRYHYDFNGNRTATVLSDGRQINYLYYGSGHLHQISLDDEVIIDIERDRLHREIFRTQSKLASRYELDPLGWSTVYLRNGEVYIGKAKHNAQKRYGKTGCATDIYTGITAKEGAKKTDGTLMKDTDVAQGVEQIVYEVLLEMGKEGLITGKITNKNRPVNPAKESKKGRRAAGLEWLKENVGEDYKSDIRQKITDHYEPRGKCKCPE